MPIYEYKCESCAHHLEALQRLSDAPLMDCPECNKPSLKKQISAAGFRLSGGGWYETDFKSGNKKNLAGDSGSSSSGNSAGASSTTGSSASGSSSGGSSNSSSTPAASAPSTPAPSSTN